MDDNLISQFLDTPADADYGESDLIKMRKVQCITMPYSVNHRTGCKRLLLITQYRDHHGNAALSCMYDRGAEDDDDMQAFVNEKAAPEILDYKGDLVARLQDQIQNQACSTLRSTSIALRLTLTCLACNQSRALLYRSCYRLAHP